MPVPQAVIGALSALREARNIKRRAFRAVHHPMQSAVAHTGGPMVWGPETPTAGGLSAIREGHRAPSKWSVAWTAASFGASAVATTASIPGSITRTHRETEAFLTNPHARAPWWIRATVWALILLYPFWLIAQYAPALKLFPTMPLSPTWGHVFGGPGFDPWDLLNPGQERPAGWTPTDAELAAAACLAPPLEQTTVVQVGWFADSLTTAGQVIADELLDVDNLRAYGKWFFSGAKFVAAGIADAFLDDQDAPPPADVVQAGATTCAPCPTGPVSTYGAGKAWGGHTNGQIPVAALTRLETAPGQHLRSDAATAFDTMSRAYQADTGRPLRVTDSYRPLASQVRLAATKGLYREGGLAAVPGTSDHGWGLAVDLDLDTRAQAWMRTNAHRFGYIEDTPREPWHWAYKGGTGQDYPATATLACNTPALTGA